MKQLSLAALAALSVLLGLSACSGTQTDLCEQNNVRCAEPEVCDPTDGVCKCGGAGGVDCGENAVCDADSNTCLSTLCDGTVCRGGTACDPADGVCKCGGPNGEVCPSATVCDPMTQECVAASSCSDVVCRPGETCQPSTGECVCGSAPCPLGQACAQGATGELTCVEDRCAGVTCANERYACDPADGQCKCGGLDGAVCQGGETCSCPPGVTCAEGDFSQFQCVPGSACGDKTCTGGTTCDPADGQCKCGGPGGDVCSAEQLCNLELRKCQGGEQCKLADGSDKQCPAGTTCDPEDGECKCGGRGGVVCAPATSTSAAEVCVFPAGGEPACRAPCDPNASGCATDTYCYFNAVLETPAAYCTEPTGSVKEGMFCSGATDCFDEQQRRPMHCAGYDPANEQNFGRCRPYCDPRLEDWQTCRQIPAQECVALEGQDTLGFCQPLQN